MAPTGVAAFQQVDEAPGVPGVGVVVAGKEIAELIEGKFLGIPKASMNLLEIGTVGGRTLRVSVGGEHKLDQDLAELGTAFHETFERIS